MSKVVVVDIETTDTEITSKILTIGAVIVDTEQLAITKDFYVRVDYEIQEDRTTSMSTMDWWLDESRVAGDFEKTAYYEAFENPEDRMVLKDALTRFNRWLKTEVGKRPKIFGNGCEFDNAILEHAMKQCGIKPNWDHGCNQSLRTAVWFGRELLNFDPKYNIEFPGTKHHALADAEHEGLYLIAILKELKNHLG